MDIYLLCIVPTLGGFLKFRRSAESGNYGVGCRGSFPRRGKPAGYGKSSHDLPFPAFVGGMDFGAAALG
jgi:hypothetical protein